VAEQPLGQRGGSATRRLAGLGVAEPPTRKIGWPATPYGWFGHPHCSFFIIILLFLDLNFKINIFIMKTVHFDPNYQLLKNFDGRNFVVISIDQRSKLSKKKKNLGILKFWRAYPKCLDIIFHLIITLDNLSKVVTSLVE
jgi:hypothetical protein